MRTRSVLFGDSEGLMAGLASLSQSAGRGFDGGDVAGLGGGVEIMGGGQQALEILLEFVLLLPDFRLGGGLDAGLRTGAGREEGDQLRRVLIDRSGVLL